MKLTFFLSVLVILGPPLYAADLVYEEKVEQPYSQFWYAGVADRLENNSSHIYVRGEGKLGDLVGLLYLDCAQPRFSRWEATKGSLTPEQVPVQVIQVIRKKYC